MWYRTYHLTIIFAHIFTVIYDNAFNIAPEIINIQITDLGRAMRGELL